MKCPGHVVKLNCSNIIQESNLVFLKGNINQYTNINTTLSDNKDGHRTFRQININTNSITDQRILARQHDCGNIRLQQA